MNQFKMPEDINHQRRRFLGTAAMAISAAQFGLLSSVLAASADPRSLLADGGPTPGLNGGVAWLNSAPVSSQSYLDRNRRWDLCSRRSSPLRGSCQLLRR